jgi:hypothetical protein
MFSKMCLFTKRYQYPVKPRFSGKERQGPLRIDKVMAHLARRDAFDKTPKESQ